MTDIAVSAGHYAESPGAHHDNFYEYPEAKYWAELIRYALDRYCNVSIVPTGTLTSKVEWINEQKAGLAIEIHFNALMNGPPARGSKTLHYHYSQRGMVFARMVQEALSSVYKPDMGIGPGYMWDDDTYSYTKPLYFLKETHMPAVIIEPEFVYNPEKIHKWREVAILRVAAALLEARKRLIGD